MVTLENGIGIVFLSNTTSNSTHGCDQSNNTAFKYDKIYTYTEGIDYTYTFIFMAMRVMPHYGGYTRAWRSRSLTGWLTAHKHASVLKQSRST